MTKPGSALEERAIAIVATAGLPRPDLQHKFALPRRWQFDLAWPEQKVALEVEGGIWISGRHTRGSGFRKDVEKYNAAAVRGWVVVRATTDMINPTHLIPLILAAFAARRPAVSA